MTYQEKIEALAKLIETESKLRMESEGFTWAAHQGNYKVSIKPGKKYTKIDVGTSGKLMLDGEEIYGIKAYGVIHRGHHYGNLDTINDWFWGCYYPQKKGA